MPRGVLQTPRGPPRRSRTLMGATADCIGSRLTLPKFHLATLKSQNDHARMRISGPLASLPRLRARRIV